MLSKFPFSYSRRVAIVCTLVLSLLALTQAAALGQSGRVPVPSDAGGAEDGKGAVEEEVLRVRTDLVSLPVSVRGEGGAPVAGLTEESFFVYDNGVRQRIESFNRERVPANIVLLLDASGSVFSQMRLIREAAKGFVQGLMAQDRVCVMQFADRVELLQDWTAASETEKLLKSLEWRYHPGQSTVFYDGLYLAARQQLAGVEGRRIIILLTDGIDNAERRRASYQDALSAVRTAEASVYVVSLTEQQRSMLEKRVGKGRLARLFSGANGVEVQRYLSMLDAAERELGELARVTGGQLFLPRKETDLDTAYRAIAEELRAQYIITYKPQPAARAGQYRRIRVLVSPGTYEVGAREGYSVRR